LATPRASRFRPLLVLALFLAAWWLAPVAVRNFSRASFSLFEAPGWLAYARLKDAQDYWSLRNHSQNELIEAGRDATRQANAALLQVQQDAALRDENDRLRVLLQMPPEPGFRYVFARVIRRDETAWWQEIVIRQGRGAGLAVGQGVVFIGGVVGRIARVDDFTAVVELASSPAFRVDANLGGDLNPVIFQGVTTAPFQTPAGEVRGEIHNVSSTLTLANGGAMLLVTSNLGGVFPSGLPMGEVDRLAPGDDGLFQTGAVKLDPRLADLHEVAVLVPDASGTAFPPLAPASNPPGAAPLPPVPQP
jgi:rod shape-determining protein MreC